MAFRLHPSAVCRLVCFVAMALMAASSAILSTTTNNNVATNQPSQPSVLLLEKGSTLNVRFSMAKATENTEANESPSKHPPVDDVEEESNVTSFPGIYIAHYSYQPSSVATTASNLENGDWLTESDVLRIECDDDNDLIGSDGEKVGVDVVRSCKGHLLIRSKDEYLGIGSRIITAKDEPLEQPPPSSNRLVLHSLEYDSSLTERWIHPRMKVATEGQQQPSRQRQLPEEHQHQHKAKASSLRRTEQARERMDVTYRDENSSSQYYSTIPFYECYYDYEGTMDWIRDFVATYSVSSLLEVNWFDIGDSWLKTQGSPEGHDIYALTITKKPQAVAVEAATPTTANTGSTTFQKSAGGATDTSGNQNKAPFLIVSSTHAREYTPPILVRLWLEHLIAKVEAGDPASLSILEHTEIHWIPYLNPDGRILAETTQPLRRKNVDDQWTENPLESNICAEDAFGVDLNRNCPFEWGKSDGSSTKPCSSFSRGSEPGSEPETKALESYSQSIFPLPQRASNAIIAGENDYSIRHNPGVSVEGSSKKWRGYDPQTTKGVFVDVHSYGKVYIYPWGNQNTLCPNDVSFRAAMGHVESMTGLSALGPGPDHYGVASGATDDWAYGVLGAFSMTWELGSAFHEPCDDFEDEHGKHFGAFDYLASIAPFPFALGRGPVLVEARASHSQISLYYSNQQQESDDLQSAINLSNLTVRGEFEYDDDGGEFWGTREIPTTTTTIPPTTSTTTRMGTHTVSDLGETIEMRVVVKLPEVIPSDEDPIDFWDNDSSDTTTDERETSRVDKIRIFYGGTNPMVGAATANSTFATQPIGESVTDLFWEMELSDPESVSHQVHEWVLLYRIPITKQQLWEAFGNKDHPETYTQHLLYFQAMDDAGNLGPIMATSLTIAVLEEEGGDASSGSESSSAGEREAVPFPPPTAAPQAQSSPFTAPPRPASNDWSSSTAKSIVPDTKPDTKNKASVVLIDATNEEERDDFEFGADDAFLGDYNNNNEREGYDPSPARGETVSSSGSGAPSVWMTRVQTVLSLGLLVLVPNDNCF